jgi:SAM-dependent methyltransferase
VKSVILVAALTLALAVPAAARQAPQPYKPEVGQQGKDVVWVPTPPELVEKMLDLAKVTPEDFVVDLGSGDGRNVIAAARRGARGLGVEYNPDMVSLSERRAAEAGVSDKAKFQQGDLFEADFSQATVLALFLMPDNLDLLQSKILDLKPGTRVVLNTFPVRGWDADETERLDGTCAPWCTSLLYYVPAKVAGTWRIGDGTLAVAQEFQRISGSVTRGGQATAIASGSLRGDRITFAVGETTYTGRVTGDTIEGTLSVGGRTEDFRATRQR